MKTFLAAVMTLPMLLGAADLYLAGDSTMCDYAEKRAPLTGWGTALKSLVKPGVNVTNLAMGGRSSKSFLTEKRWDKILASAKPGDFVIIQFGHNDAHKGEKNRYRITDAKDTYRYYLKIYIAEARAKGLIPVLCTQTALCRFRPDGSVLDREPGAYIVACREVAKETGCDFVDLNTYARDKLAAMGQEKAIRLYMTLAEGEFPNYPQGRKDTCHLRTEGAEFYAKGFVELAKKQKLPIAEIFQ